MNDILSKFSAGELIGLVAVVGGLTVAGISVVVGCWRNVRVTEIQAALKQQMLEKGMSPADIEQVMNAGHQSDAGLVVSSGNEAADRAVLVQRMVDEGYEGEDIERVLKAYQPNAKGNSDKVAASNA